MTRNPAFTDPSGIAFLSVTQLAEAYRQRGRSPVEVARAMLDRIDALNPQLAAYYEIDRDNALAAARAAESRWQRGAPLGLLDGVPVSIKDHLDVRGLRTARGYSIERIAASTFDAPVSARLREAGAVILGKTTMPELSVIVETTTRAFGATRNPWNPDHTTGGSSGGAAAAAAAGLCTSAIGSDGGGSIRLPASFTGLVGHKPTLGRVPYFPGQTDRTVAGPIARTVADVAATMSVIARPDGRDWMELPADDTDYLAALRDPPRRLRVGVSLDYGYQHVDAEVGALFERALAAFAPIASSVKRLDRVCDDPFRIYMIQATLRLRASKRTADEPRAISSVLDFAARLTPEDQQAMIDQRNKLGADLLAVFRECDVLVSPTAPTIAPRINEFYPDGDTLDEAGRNLIGFTCPVNLVQMPAVSIPCGLTKSGMPVGLQIAGPKFSDALLLRVAHAIEAALRERGLWQPIGA